MMAICFQEWELTEEKLAYWEKIGENCIFHMMKTVRCMPWMTVL